MTNAISGMSPWALVVGMRGRRDAGTAVLTQAGTLTVICRRQRPSWMTSGMFVPTGMLLIVNLPSTPVTAWTSGLPDTSAPQGVQATPGAKAWTGALGT